MLGASIGERPLQEWRPGLSAIEEAISALGSSRVLAHLGAADSEDSALGIAKRELSLSFEAIRENIGVEMEELRKLQRIGRIATVAGLFILLFSGVLAMVSFVELAMVTALAGLLVEVYPVLVFSQIERVRS